MTIFRTEQLVCKVCGYNMIGYLPNNCPFCGANNNNFITAEFCSKNYTIIENKITDKISSLESSPKLGLEHRAYSINTGNHNLWIDCPSAFKDNLKRMDKILFTHHHFLGASNLYRSFYTAFVWINKEDSMNNLTRNYCFDKTFLGNFELNGIKAFHINGHTSGFTVYLFEDILFLCDYVILNENSMSFNPYGPRKETLQAAFKIKEIYKNYKVSKVCGYDYTIDFSYWNKKFEVLISKLSNLKREKHF